jgi:DAK2 domain fusion protein YloV
MAGDEAIVAATPSILSHAGPPAGPISGCDGLGLKALAAAGLAWLEHNQQAVNALNVFPVPDGDTGTNMVLTMRSAYAEVASAADHRVDAVAHQLAHGALMGARGNSGVILSQLWRGFARGLDGVDVCDVQQTAQAFRTGCETAYKGVVRPVEGTILTVARAAAEAADEAAAGSADLRGLLAAVVAACRQAVIETPELLPLLKQAGVVDAGGQGLTYLLEGMLRYLNGEALAAAATLEREQALRAALEPGELGYGYDVQFILKGQNLDVAAVRGAIDAMGDSTLVVGDANTIKVHVHVHDPGVPLSYGAQLGVLADVVVENMQEQYQQFVMKRLAPGEAASAGGGPAAPAGGAAPAGVPGSVPGATRAPALAQPHPDQVGVLVVAAGEGLAQVFASLGAAAVVPGGQTMNPSTEDILVAARALPCRQVIVLPNNKNIILAAEQAAGLVNEHELAVVPTRNVPQGIAALLAFDPDAPLADNQARMAAAAEGVQCGEVTTATRTLAIDGVAVTAGQIIGLHNGRLALAGDDLATVVEGTLERMGAEQAEIVTLYYGDSVDEAGAEALAERLRARFAGAEFEVVAGRQPHYHYILSSE